MCQPITFRHHVYHPIYSSQTAGSYFNIISKLRTLVGLSSKFLADGEQPLP